MITIDYDRCTLALRIPYNESCVEDIKSMIPQRARTWDPELKAWYIGSDYLTALMEILRKHFDLCEISTSPNIPGSLITSNESEDRDG